MTSAFYKNHRPPALLALADGSLFPGVSIGASGQAVGEVVFNTAMTGYQEILSDPSYADQLITFTYPHIGNVGVNRDDQESFRVWAKGLIIRDASPVVSNWRAQQSLNDYLLGHQIVGIAEVDTRRLTRILREKGAQNGCIMTGPVDPQQALAAARAYPGLVGMDLAKEVSISQTQNWTERTWRSSFVPSSRLNPSSRDLIAGSQGAAGDPAIKSRDDVYGVSRDGIYGVSWGDVYHVVVYDYGVKYQILRLLADRNCRVTLVPARTPADEIIALKPDGVVLANGPGDPAMCDYAIAAIQKLFTTEIPIFGICLGFQLLALASGGKTRKMKFGHHGANHPVLDVASGRVMITSQNHGFCVEEETLPACWTVTHRSLFDQSLQGIAHREKPVFAFQGHPEASPGPHDIIVLFDQFIHAMEKR